MESETSAELERRTDFRKHAEALEELGAEEQSLAAHLRELARQYDMDAIKSILSEINTQ